VEAGDDLIQWGGRINSRKFVATGLYFYRLRAGEFAEIRRILLMKSQFAIGIPLQGQILRSAPVCSSKMW